MSTTTTRQPTPPRRSLRLLTLTALTLLSLLTTSTGYAQTTCSEPDRCMSKARVSALVAAACAESEAKANRLDDVTRDLDAAETQRDEYRGQLLELRQNPPDAPTRAPLWLRIALDVGIGATAAGTGTLAAVGAPSEVVVGFAVASVGVLVSRLVLEVVW